MVWPSSSGRDPFEDEDDEGGGDTYSGDIGTYGADYTSEAATLTLTLTLVLT
jgi:hypothetical protein